MTRPKAILLSTQAENPEMEELVFSLGYDLVETVVQYRNRPDPQWFLGRGKLDEAGERAQLHDAELVVVNAALKPNQIFNLQQFFEKEAPRGGDKPAAEVYDRIRVILEIFSERAQSQEARLQVELAKLRYEVPIVKEYIHLAKKGEHPGFLAGGEYEVNQYYDRMKRRMSSIRKELDRASKERQVRRKHRRRGGFHLVSLAGYTNAGKSSLLRALADQDTLVENKYFSTLSTKTRRAQSDRREILVTDTVGFIEDLPPWVIDAFHSTLEEIALADVILLAVDASDPLPELRRRLHASLQTLWEFDSLFGENGDGHVEAAGEGRRNGSGLAPIVTVLNKVDLLDADDLREKENALKAEGLIPGTAVAVSAKMKLGLDELYRTIYAALPDYDEYEVALPQSPDGEKFLAWLRQNADLLDLTRGNEVHVHFEAKGELRATVVGRLREVGAVPLREAARGLPPRRQREGDAPEDLPADEVEAAFEAYRREPA